MRCVFLSATRLDGGCFQRFHAHKLILSLGSEVFAAMFQNDAFCESRAAEVHVPDIEAPTFRRLLVALYTDEPPRLRLDNVLSVLYAGASWPSAAGRICASCSAQIRANFARDRLHQLSLPQSEHELGVYAPATSANLRPRRACERGSRADRRRFREGEWRGWRARERRMLQALAAASLEDVDVSTLCEVLARDSLRAKELKVYEASLDWARAHCKDRGIEPTGANLREALGAALFLIRFPIVS